MAESGTTQFSCASCGARYKVAHVEAPPSTGDQQIFCLSCGVSIPSYDGKMALKYFRVERAPRHRRTARSQQNKQTPASGGA